MLTFKSEAQIFLETWESAELGEYPPRIETEESLTISGDAGDWQVWRNDVALVYNCEIEAESDNQFVVLKTGPRDQFSTDPTTAVTWIEVSSDPIPLTQGTKIRMTVDGEPSSVFSDVQITGETQVRLELIDDRSNVLAYVFQRAADYDPVYSTLEVDDGMDGLKTIGFHEALVGNHDNGEVTYTRDLYDDFSQAPLFEGEGASIVKVRFKVQLANALAVQMIGALDNLEIGTSIDSEISLTPKITSHPSSEAVMLGETAVFSVEASSAEEVSYQWQRKFGESSEWEDISDDSSFSGTSTSMLQVDVYASFYDQDQYRCVVRNLFRTSTSSPATLTILPFPQSNGILSFESIPADEQWGSYTPEAISDDGTIIVGSSNGVVEIIGGRYPIFGTRGFLWSKTDGQQLFDEDPFFPYDISTSGDTVIGNASSGSTLILNQNNEFSATALSEAYGLSADGSTVVGASDQRAAKWENNEIYHLEDPSLDSHSSVATSVSENGAVIAGSLYKGNGSVAFTWNAKRGIKELPNPFSNRAEATAISADGTTVVGNILFESEERLEAISRPFRWNAQQGMRLLSYPPLVESEGELRSEARSVSADGCIVVGYVEEVEESQVIERAFLWNSDGQLIDLNNLITSHGFDDHGWSLNRAVDITADGNSIVGLGNNLDRELGRVFTLSGLREIGWTPEPAVFEESKHEIRSVFAKAGDYYIKVPTLPGWNYQLQRKSDLRDSEWINVGGPIEGIGCDVAIVHENAADLGRQFYQVIATESNL